MAYLVVCGAVALALALVVLVRNRELDTDLLAALGLVGAVAIIVVALPSDDDR